MKSKKRRLIEQLDRLVQQLWLPDKCFVCNRQADELHHYIQKGQSSALRWDRNNLIPLCVSCHWKHHRLGDERIHERIEDKKGKEWLIYINSNRNNYFRHTEANLEEKLCHLKSLLDV